MQGSEPADEARHHSPWMCVGALLAVVAVDVTIRALTLRSDPDDTQQLDSATQEQASTKQQLDTTQKQLATAQQDAKDLQSATADGKDAPASA